MTISSSETASASSSETDPSRLERIERHVIVAEHLATYAYHLDFGLLDPLADQFAPSCRLDVVNFLPGTGENLTLEGRDAVRDFYSRYVKGPSLVRGGHHVSNVITAPGADGHIEFSAYFLTSATHVTWGQGGQYRGALANQDGRWRFTRMAVISWVNTADAAQGAVPLDGLAPALHPLPVVDHV